MVGSGFDLLLLACDVCGGFFGTGSVTFVPFFPSTQSFGVTVVNKS